MTDSTGIELQQLLSTVVLSKAIVLAGERGLSRRVSRVNAMEVPDVLPWVRAGELLLTTGYPFRDQPDVLRELIPELAQRGVAGLGIKTRRFIETVPECALEAASRADFPLIELPPDTAFSDVVRVLMERIIGTETEGVKELQNRIQVLIRYLLMQTDTSALLDVVEGTVPCSLALLHGSTWSASTTLLRLPGNQLWELVQALQTTGLTEGEPFIVRSPGKGWRAYAVRAGEFDGSPIHLVAFEGSHSLSVLDLMTLEHVGP